jgi:hypothetical protein
MNEGIVFPKKRRRIKGFLFNLTPAPLQRRGVRTGNNILIYFFYYTSRYPKERG